MKALSLIFLTLLLSVATAKLLLEEPAVGNLLLFAIDGVMWQRAFKLCS